MIRHAWRVAVSVAREKLKRVTRSPQWRGVEKRFLKENPDCEACGGEKRLQVHHIKPFHERPDLELDERNLLTLCMGPHECHLVVGHYGNWKKSNPNVCSLAAAMRSHYDRSKNQGT